MPYVLHNHREDLDAHRSGVVETPGDLVYQITTVIEEYRRVHSRDHNGDSYTVLNEIVGALDNAKDEFRRRVIHPYEERKCAENGDVYREVS